MPQASQEVLSEGRGDGSVRARMTHGHICYGQSKNDAEPPPITTLSMIVLKLSTGGGKGKVYGTF